MFVFSEASGSFIRIGVPNVPRDLLWCQRGIMIRDRWIGAGLSYDNKAVQCTSIDDARGSRVKIPQGPNLMLMQIDPSCLFPFRLFPNERHVIITSELAIMKSRWKMLPLRRFNLFFFLRGHITTWTKFSFPLTPIIGLFILIILSGPVYSIHNGFPPSSTSIQFIEYQKVRNLRLLELGAHTEKEEPLVNQQDRKWWRNFSKLRKRKLWGSTVYSVNEADLPKATLTTDITNHITTLALPFCLTQYDS